MIAAYNVVRQTEAYNLANASKAWLPHGSVSAQATWQNDVSKLPDALTGMMSQQGVSYPGMQKDQYRIGVEVYQQIWDGGASDSRKAIVSTSSDIEQKSLDIQMYEVEGRVEDIYFSILLLDARLRRLETTCQLLDSTLYQVRSMFANGVAMQSDCDQIEAKILTLQQQKEQLSAARSSYTNVLEIFIGEKIGQRDLVLPDEPTVSEFNDTHPQQNFFNSQLSGIDAHERAIKAASIPTVGAFASGYYGYPGYNLFKSMQSDDLSLNFMIGIKAVWNFGALYTRRSDMNKLKLQRERIDIERKIFLFNQSIAEREAWGEIISLRAQIRNDVRIVELRRSVRMAAQSQMRNGILDSTTLLSKITDEEIAENDKALHEIELIKSLYKLNHIKNR